MTRGNSRRFVVATLLAFAAASPLTAQEAVTLTGHVSSSGRPVQGATVRIPDLRLSVTTDVDGRYSIIIPSSSVRGQSVVITARNVRSQTVSATIVLVGGSMVQDLDLTPVAVARDSTVARPATPAISRPARAATVVASDHATLDSTNFEAVSGAWGFSSALAGRFPSLRVTTGSTPGGSAPLVYRGFRSIAATGTPLVVVDGIPLDGSTFADVGQRFGFGGFDYGSAIDDLNTDEIRQVQLIDPSRATAQFGGRGANGAILVTTRDGKGLNGMLVSFTQRVTFETATSLPEFQNVYGQGSAGVFSFFNGRGGGINDATAESWGPALDGRPLTQASLTEAGRPEVRYWLPGPDNVAGYFETGRNLFTSAGISAGGTSGDFRTSLFNRDTRGVTPASSLTQRGLTFTGNRRVTDRGTVSGHVAYATHSGSGRPGTGFDESNPVAGFLTMGRQVDVSALRDHRLDADGKQINWIYADHNNPYFRAFENTNESSRKHLTLGATASFALLSWLTADARVSRDAYTDNRDFSVHTSWLGGFPTARDRASFGGGGYQSQDVSAGLVDGEVSVTTSRFRQLGVEWAVTAGGALRNQRGRVLTVVYDTLAVAGDPVAQANALVPIRNSFSTRTITTFGSLSAILGKALTIAGGARREVAEMYAPDHQANLFPFASGVVDLALWRPDAIHGLGLDDLEVRAAWSRSSNGISPYDVRALYSGARSSDDVALDPVPPVVFGGALAPELTATAEAGIDAGAFGRRVQVALTVYRDRTSNVILSRIPDVGAPMTALNGGEISNRGIEAAVTLVPLRADQYGWTTTATFNRNSNRVESLPAGIDAVPLGPTRWGVALEARRGSPIGAIVGSVFLRDPTTAQLLLKNGLPIADTTVATGLRVLGSAEPAWTGALSNSLRYRALELSMLVDGQFGGQLFSASNRFGATSGNLAETAFRPDTGLLISGLDSVTGAANSTHVSTEDYYHALGGVAERWIYEASFLKLREVRLSGSMGLPMVGPFRTAALRVSLIGRNLAMWSKAPNIDPETALSASSYRGIEFGQMPLTRSIGFQLTITP